MLASSHGNPKKNPHGTDNEVYPAVQVLDLTTLQTQLPPRKQDTYKGNFGHVLIIGGESGMAGAVRLAGEAAARVGAGLVSIATQPGHAAELCATRPELMCHGVKNKRALKPLLARATVVVIGPGLGQNTWGKNLLSAVLQHHQSACKHLHPYPLVIDADALNLIAKQHPTLSPQASLHWILTPHPGEAARLLGCTAVDIQNNRITAIYQLQKQFGSVCVLKGAGTLVLGNEPNASVLICNAGNPGMASGGMGDVLSGIIAGLAAQGIAPTDAACLGVALHARAGDLAAAHGGQRGLLASDLFPYLQQLVNPTIS